MNIKIKTLLQALMDEINEVKGVKDSKQSPDGWWKLINWKEPEMRTAFDSLSENTRKLIIDEGLCPDCPEKADEARTEAERAMSHFNITQEEWDKLTPEKQQEYIDKLPPRGSGGKDFPKAPKGDAPPETVPCIELLKKEHSDWSDEKIAEQCEESESIDEWDREIDAIVGKDAQLTYGAKKEHPDSDYAYIDPDCKKVDGKTPQSCRHLLIHDPAHVRAALAALGGARSGKPPPYADKAKPKVCTAAKKFKIESEVCGTAGKKKDALDPYAVLERANKIIK